MTPPDKGKGKGKGKGKKTAEAIPKKSRCAICLRETKSHQPRALLRCGHIFCGHHLQKWAKQETTCPECRARFTKVTRVPAENLEKYNQKYNQGKSRGKGKEKRSTVHFPERTQKVPSYYLEDYDLDEDDSDLDEDYYDLEEDDSDLDEEAQLRDLQDYAEEPQPDPQPQEEMPRPQQMAMAGPAPDSPAGQGAARRMPERSPPDSPSRDDAPGVGWYPRYQPGLQQRPVPTPQTAAAQRAMARSREQARARQAQAEEAERQAAVQQAREEAARIRIRQANAEREEEARAVRAMEAEARSIRFARPRPPELSTGATPAARRAMASAEEIRNRRFAAVRRRAVQAAAGRAPRLFGEVAPAGWPGARPEYAAEGARRPAGVAAEWPIVRPPYSADAAPVPPEPYPLASVEGLPLPSPSPQPVNVPPPPPRLQGARVGNVAVPTPAAAAAIAALVARERASPALEPSCLDVFDRDVDEL